MARITLESANYFHNLDLLSQKTGDTKKLIVVLKDNAYGHGLLQMAELAHKYGITQAAVKNYSEAKQIAPLFDNTLVLCEASHEVLDNNISIAINQIEDICVLPHKSKVELAVDSGMHRNGINPQDIEKAIQKIQHKQHTLYRVYTHFRSADILSSELFWQMENFKIIKAHIKDICKKYCIPTPFFHCANSAATLRLKTIEDDFVRCGIASYGYVEMDKPFGPYDLKPVLSLWAKKMSSRTLLHHQRVGYGGAYEVPKDMQISTYDIGYGDGFFRSNADKNLYAKEGEKILGKISMDSMSIQSVKEEICIFDDAKPLAKEFGTISYEILTKLSPTLKRIII